ncbi:MAG: hypothetical protein WAJ87_13430 [Bryobacteraceae bacterium]
MDKLDASVVALEGGAITRAKKLSDRFFPKLGDTAQTGVELGEKPTPVMKRKLLERIVRVCAIY